MSATLELDDWRSITYQSALKKDANIINQAAYFAAAKELYQKLWGQRQAIQAVVKHDLRLGNRDSCVVQPQDQWIRGSFNVCIPVEVRSARFHKMLIFRCPMPHKFAEARYPGTVDEKLSSEVGTYVWMQDRCHDVRIPHLYSFGFSDHRHVGHLRSMPLDSFYTNYVLLVYSSYMSNKGLSTSAFGACSNAISGSFFDTQSSRTIPPVQLSNDYPPHICCLSISVPILAKCSPTHGRHTGTTQSGCRGSSEAWLA